MKCTVLFFRGTGQPADPAGLGQPRGELPVQADARLRQLAAVLAAITCGVAWTAAPVALELTGPAGGSWLIGAGEPPAVVRAEPTAWMRALSGRHDNPNWNYRPATKPPSRPYAWPGSCSDTKPTGS